MPSSPTLGSHGVFTTSQLAGTFRVETVIGQGGALFKYFSLAFLLCVMAVSEA